LHFEKQLTRHSEEFSSSKLHFKRQQNAHKTCAKEKLEEIGTRLGISPGNSLTQLAKQMGVSAASSRNDIKLLGLFPHTTVVQMLCGTAEFC
jgi:hypothetical protein